MPRFLIAVAALLVIAATPAGAAVVDVVVQAGHEVKLFDARAGATAEAKTAIIAMLERLAAKGGLKAEDLQTAPARLTICAALQDLAGCAVIVEAIIEELGAKQSLFAVTPPRSP